MDSLQNVGDKMSWFFISIIYLIPIYKYIFCIFADILVLDDIFISHIL
jgi:hypothetical protein